MISDGPIHACGMIIGTISIVLMFFAFISLNINRMDLKTSPTMRGPYEMTHQHVKTSLSHLHIDLEEVHEPLLEWEYLQNW